MSWLFFAADATADERAGISRLQIDLPELRPIIQSGLRKARALLFRRFVVSRYFFDATSNGAPVLARMSSTMSLILPRGPIKLHKR